MTQEGTSQAKKKFTRPGTLASLVNQKRSLIPLKNKALVVRSNEKGPSHPVMVAPVQPESTPSPPQAVEQVSQPEATEEVQPETTIEDEVLEEGPSLPKRRRGKTLMNSVHGRSDRKLIELNDLHQPVGPTEAVVKEFASFLGTLARKGLCVLLMENIGGKWMEKKLYGSIPRVNMRFQSLGKNGRCLLWFDKKNRRKHPILYHRKTSS